ncbi:MAG: NADH-quinone oxidoreductase subunit J [Rectinemataceae bacterium]|jgi:NADH-quinone oxidoreductase subunit J
MNALLAIAAVVAVASTAAVVLQRRAVHALLYLIVSFFALAVAMLALGAAFAAALEVVVYAGAILVLFVFVVMMIGVEGPVPGARAWLGPVILSIVLLGELAYAFVAQPGLLVPPAPSVADAMSPKAVGMALFGPYALCAEIAAFLLLSGLVGAYHLGRRLEKRVEGPKAEGGEA